ncbi:MAG: 2'-deoxycytidine 5'-triphosphate deaminase [Planctomycetota bacterium]
MSPSPRSGHILIDRDLLGLLELAFAPAPGGRPPQPAQIQPASLDLRLGPRAWPMRAGFLPGGDPIADRIASLAGPEIRLDEGGTTFERGQVYLVELEERLALPGDISARFNPRSSTGRCDLFTRVLTNRHPRFDEAPAGYRGPLYLEVCPLSFDVELRRGDRLCQVRLQKGEPALTTAQLRALYRETPLAFENDRPLAESEVTFGEQGELLLGIGLQDRNPAGWCARPTAHTLNFSAQNHHDPKDFWDPIEAPNGRAILTPNHFYILASAQRIKIPPHLAAEMLPVDIGIGELRNNYAGFFDNGFGWEEDARQNPTGTGTTAVLEVRAHDVPFLVEHNQLFFRLRFFHTSGRPQNLYGQNRPGPSYRHQDLTLARTFKSPT